MAVDKGNFIYDFSMPDAGNQKENKNQPVITYEAFLSDSGEASAENPIMVLEDPEEVLRHHQNGTFLNPRVGRTAFEYEYDSRVCDADIALIDSRFISLLDWLGEEKITVRLSGKHTEKGYAIYKMRAVDSTGRTNHLASSDAFLQLVITRLLQSSAQEEGEEDEDEELEESEDLVLTDISSMMDFLRCAGNALPATIRRWAVRNIALTRSNTISPEERRHAQRALSMVLNIQWKSDYFESIDPIEARRILDEELYGLENVKQRIIETIIQINRTHTLPAYGLLLAGPAGTGKSQLAYAVARILKLPWTSLDMSAIHDSEALTGSPRVYANAKPGRIMEAFSKAGASNLVFIINELDKADSESATGNPADALLTLLDNLGYTDNYIECMIPTSGVYPIATANDKSRISEPLMTRFAVIDIPDYTPEEKAVVFTKFSLPRVLRRMGMRDEECIVPEDAVRVVVDKFSDQPGCRDLEQAAEHLAANALFQIETRHLSGVKFTPEMTRKVLNM